MSEPTTNGMICTGLTWTQSAVSSGNINQLDPDGLIQGTDGEQALTPSAATPDAGVAACRAYYDSSEYGLQFCCQTIITTETDVDTTAVAFLVSSYGQMAPEGDDPTLTKDAKTYYPDAQSFKGANTIATGMALLASTIAFLQ